ncbi:MAG: hemolysin secretion protein D [Planctomycetota bacterium]|nr:MAG: hemolysin secretion protein D [Planctomycetota bacterium]
MNGFSRTSFVSLALLTAGLVGCFGADGSAGNEASEASASGEASAAASSGARADGQPVEQGANSTQAAASDDGRPPAGGVTGGRDVQRETLVVAESLTRGAIRDEIVVSARIEARYMLQVLPKLGGLPVTEVLVDEGEFVQAGDLLLRLYDQELSLTESERASAATQAEKEIARAQLQLEEDQARIVRAERQAEKAKADLLRLTGLRSEELVNQQEVDDARLAAEISQDDIDLAKKTSARSAISLELAEIAARQAELQWERAKVDLSHTEVRAPLSGVISERSVEVGQLSSASAPAFVIVDLEHPVLNLRVPQDSLAKLAPGQRVEARAVTLRGTVFAGTVRSVNPVLDATTGSVHVIVDLEPGADVRPGLFCQAHVITAARDNALLVDKRAVLHTDGLPHVFAITDDGDSVRKLSFTPGSSTALTTEILGDADGAPVPDDLRVVVVGQENLKDGGRVRIQDTAY